ncbi:general stress protein [Paenisporosarcina indica]|uniref:general stress protein n=1 Tax=Paenisporosarcina indica TaxID=650093 RepID=UPI00094F67F4|nr:general stress protein [Paenisporosarcina indica]
MNAESNRRIEVARTEDEMYERLEQMKLQGYAESDIHVISSDRNQMHTLNRYSDVSTHEAGTFIDKFKSWFTGDDAIKEGLKKLDLTDSETNRYAQDVASGGFVLFTDQSPTLNEVVGSNQNEFEEEYDTIGTSGNSYESYHGEERPVLAVEPGFEDRKQDGTNTFVNNNEEYTTTTGTEFVESRFNETEPLVSEEARANINDTTTFGADEPRSDMTSKSNREEPQSDYAKEQGFTASTNQFVNEPETRLDEPQDRFARGETFSTDPYLTREKDHIGHSMQEDSWVQKNRPTLNESITNEQQTDGFQSPGADPNLGPAPFGSVVESDPSFDDKKHDFEKDPRTFNNRGDGEEYTLSESEENVLTNEYEEKLDHDKYRANVPQNNKLF